MIPDLSAAAPWVSVDSLDFFTYLRQILDLHELQVFTCHPDWRIRRLARKELVARRKPQPKMVLVA